MSRWAARLEDAMEKAINHLAEHEPVDPIRTLAQHFEAQATASAKDGLTSQLEPAAKNGLSSQLERSAKEAPDNAVEGDGAWTAEAFLETTAVNHVVATALLSQAEQPGEQPGELTIIRSLAHGATRTSLVALLRSAQVVEKLADALLPALREVATAPAATAEALHSKFAMDGQGFTMSFGGLQEYFEGLERAVGRPSAHVSQAMEDEHVQAKDSDENFSASNYGTTTTSKAEYYFVANPPDQTRGTWAPDTTLRAINPHLCRKPMPLADLQKRVDQCNEQLQQLKQDGLLAAEAIGARLCARRPRPTARVCATVPPTRDLAESSQTPARCS